MDWALKTRTSANLNKLKPRRFTRCLIVLPVSLYCKKKSFCFHFVLGKTCSGTMRLYNFILCPNIIYYFLIFLPPCLSSIILAGLVGIINYIPVNHQVQCVGPDLCHTSIDSGIASCVSGKPVKLV